MHIDVPKQTIQVCVCVDRAQRQEREVMLKLKEVVDRQRDELRAKVQQIATISKEVEAVRRHRHTRNAPCGLLHKTIAFLSHVRLTRSRSEGFREGRGLKNPTGVLDNLCEWKHGLDHSELSGMLELNFSLSVAEKKPSVLLTFSMTKFKKIKKKF